jgi:hypothetical protein
MLAGEVVFVKLFEEEGGVLDTIDCFVCFSVCGLQTAKGIMRNLAQL